MSKKIWLSMHPRKFSNHVTVRAPSEPKVYIFLPTRFFHKPFKTLCVLSESRSDTRMKETTFSFSLTGSFLACECTLHLAPPILKSDWLSIVPISALIGQYAPSRARLNGFFLSLLAKNSRNFSCFD